jgi:hypothetical protein
MVAAQDQLSEARRTDPLPPGGKLLYSSIMSCRRDVPTWEHSLSSDPAAQKVLAEMTLAGVDL